MNNNLQLFKQAIRDGLSNKIDKIVLEDNGVSKCSLQHRIAMRNIIREKTIQNVKCTSKVKQRIIAILIAAAILLTGCGIIFRNEIREVLGEGFASVIFNRDKDRARVLEEIYEPSYMPEGYSISNTTIAALLAEFVYTDSDGNFIEFSQRASDGMKILIDNDGYSLLKTIDTYNVYYRYTGESHIVIWDDGKYILSIRSNEAISDEELVLIIGGIAKNL